MARFLSEEDEMTKTNVCVISTTLASELFAYQNPLTNEIKVGKYYYRVVGLVRTPGDLLRDLKEQKQRVLDESALREAAAKDRKSTRLNSSHVVISYAVFCLKKKNTRL